MRIVHLQLEKLELPPSKTRKEAKVERCAILIANQTFEDKKSAEKLFAERLQNINNKRLKLRI
jgi:hypothetical protein